MGTNGNLIPRFHEMEINTSSVGTRVTNGNGTHGTLYTELRDREMCIIN